MGNSSVYAIRVYDNSGNDIDDWYQVEAGCKDEAIALVRNIFGNLYNYELKQISGKYDWE